MHCCSTALFYATVLSRLLNNFESSSSDILARVHFLYYGFIAHYIEPVQECDTMLTKSFETGLSNGDNFSGEDCCFLDLILSAWLVLSFSRPVLQLSSLPNTIYICLLFGGPSCPIF